MNVNQRVVDIGFLLPVTLISRPRFQVAHKLVNGVYVVDLQRIIAAATNTTHVPTTERHFTIAKRAEGVGYR
jgi:hypothetical protein